MCDKVIAFQTTCSRCAWISPEQLEIGAGDSLRNYLMELRRQTLGAGGMSSMSGERAAPIIELENGGNGEEPRAHNNLIFRASGGHLWKIVLSIPPWSSAVNLERRTWDPFQGKGANWPPPAEIHLKADTMGSSNQLAYS